MYTDKQVTIEVLGANITWITHYLYIQVPVSGWKMKKHKTLE